MKGLAKHLVLLLKYEQVKLRYYEIIAAVLIKHAKKVPIPAPGQLLYHKPVDYFGVNLNSAVDD